MKFYIVEQHGLPVYESTSLTKALRYIGTMVRGNGFGCMLLPVAEAMAHGFNIRQA